MIRGVSKIATVGLVVAAALSPLASTPALSATVTQYLGGNGSGSVDAGFAAATSTHVKEFINFDGDGFDWLAAHTFTPIPSNHYAAQGVTLLGLDARSVDGQPWAHSPPIGAWQTGFSAPPGPYSFVFAQPVSSFGLFANDVEGSVTVTVHVVGGTESFTLPSQGSAGTTRFHGFVANGNPIGRIDFFSYDYHIIDDIQFGRSPDDTPPVVTGAPHRAPNANGWYRDDVLIDWQAVDPEPSSGQPSPPTAQTLASIEGQAITYASPEFCDAAGNCAAGSLQLSVDKTAPSIDTPTLSVNPKSVSESTELAATASDALSGLAGGEFFIGTDPGEGNGTPMALTGSQLSATIGIGLPPGVHDVGVRSVDRADNWSAATMGMLVVYDPDGAFVTGGGWVHSPPGAYVADPSLTDRASFGFVSKYLKGATVPTGETEFQFKVAGLNFHSESYEWLVVAGARAQYKGTGTINGTGNFGFLLTAIDGDLNGGGGTERFRIKIWDKDAGDLVVYDNQLGAEDGADPTTVLGGGSIVIQKT